MCIVEVSAKTIQKESSESNIGFPAQFSSFAMQFDIKSIRFHDSCDRQGDPSFEFFFIYSKLLFVQQTVQLSQWIFFFKHTI